MSEERQPGGVREGGQFRARRNPESTIELDGPVDGTTSDWPAVIYESCYIDEADLFEGAPLSRNQRRKMPGPYYAAITPTISDIKRIDLPSDVSIDAREAEKEIARFDEELGAEVSNFSAILLRTESASSSEIERLTASSKAIALAELGDTTAGRNASLIVANTAAMDRALALADRIDGSSIIAMHDALLRDTHPEWVGHWRTEQVRIGGLSVYDARFVPPHHERVPEAMGDLIRFVGRDDLPVFEQAAIAHAQFETIHPFPDGNGRVGRALIHAILKHQGVTRKVTVPVSAGLLSDPDSYFDALTEYRKGDASVIIGLMANASHAAIDNGRVLAGDIRTARSAWNDMLRARADAGSRRMLDVLVRQPAVDVALVQNELALTYMAAANAIEQLVDAGILEPASANKRNRRWLAKDVVAALDAFSIRAKRRRLA